MTQLKSSASRSSHYGLRDLNGSRPEDVVEAYSLLQEAMGCDYVEDFRSFRRTISATTDQRVLPRVIVAVSDDKMIGVVVGATLKNLSAGFIAYSAVKEAWRRRGVYTTMRCNMLRRLTHDGVVKYVVSELDEQEWLFQKYIRDWKAVALPGRYEQPQAQGLQAKPLRLVAQPVENGTTPDPSETLALVRELYKRIYRIEDVDGNESFRRILTSLTPEGPKAKNSCYDINRK